MTVWLPGQNDLTVVFGKCDQTSVLLVLFLLLGGLPRLFTVVIQAGGRPRLLPWPRASRSRTMIASSTCSRSARNSASILLISISCKDSARQDASSTGRTKAAGGRIRQITCRRRSRQRQNRVNTLSSSSHRHDVKTIKTFPRSPVLAFHTLLD